MTAEQKFYGWLARQLPRADCVRIETSTMGGVPDTNICFLGQELWVELKIVTGGRTLIRPHQHAWGHRRAYHGGRVIILSQHPCGNIFAAIFPKIRCVPHGEYLSVLGDWLVLSPDQVKTFLFPNMT